MDIVTLGAALNGSAEYVNSHFKGGSNIQIVDNPDGTQTINASGEVSSEDAVARAEIAAIKDGETLDSFGDVETALGDKADTSTTYTKTEVDTALGLKQDTISDLSTIRSGAALGATAVQPETGKGLSTNDYTTAEKTKLDGIAEGAEVNVQSNWTQTTTTADDYIKNKPTLGTAAAKNATDTYNATGTDVTTGKAVAAALATLPKPMVFKGSLGTGGTITTLPTASSSNKGYVYKVITAGTYASQSAKVGDTFISDGSVWVLIPSGDEPSGTVTNVAVANGGGLTVSGSPITSSGTITVGHSNSVTAKTSSSLKKFTYDAYGHVTGSSELSIAESNALASGIDSTKVAQIETNKNNISLVDLYNAANFNVVIGTAYNPSKPDVNYVQYSFYRDVSANVEMTTYGYVYVKDTVSSLTVDTVGATVKTYTGGEHKGYARVSVPDEGNGTTCVGFVVLNGKYVYSNLCSTTYANVVAKHRLTGNIDNISENNFDLYTSSSTNLPVNSDCFIRTTVSLADSSRTRLQEAFVVSTGVSYVRTMSNGVWNNWLQLTNQ